ncbi:hypothetical protein J41TS12_11060 [Paenibacillus antibioticophila]|uniref:Uncharacterized protein n=1 Tax=Paenibacillus antibioticophila TaxID=1274374 RepID=A0A919XTQ1_9BACL|nr:hypothetical protein [Paenibacillus antibioticophila]GIO36245.1 hypothetical protein J41TS12_11060 [Paenibacillus antibioticophila]
MSEGNLTVLPQSSGGSAGGGAIVDLEFGSAADLRKKLDAMKQKLNLTREFFREVMQEGVDYGTIPGTDKPTLYKPGAEGLCEFYNLAPTVASKVEDKNHETGYYAIDITIRLIHRGTGSIIAEGVGHANTYESRYRWRWYSDYKLPKGVDKDSLYKEERDEWKNGRKTGNTYTMYRMENDDMHSIWNTVLKMAKKRALVDAVLSATRSSGIFSQTEDELNAYLNGEDPEAEPEGNAPTTTRRQSNTTRTTSNASSRSNAGSEGANAKNRAFELAKDFNGGNMDWKWLGERASEALGRHIQKVVTDVQPNEWKVVVEYLEQYGQNEISFQDLPEDMR